LPDTHYAKQERLIRQTATPDQAASSCTVNYEQRSCTIIGELVCTRDAAEHSRELTENGMPSDLVEALKQHPETPA
jgi:hypothetical protein